MNKKADISIAILVLGVVALCFLVLMSFFYQSSQISNSFLGVGLIETIKAVDEEQRFLENSEFRTNYENNFNMKGVSITISDDEILGRYFKGTQNFVRDCNDENWKILAECKSEIVKVIYKRQ
ncbi:MAG TPA: hypothetical protein VJZ93_02850 [Candidatus Nanoarchaeia archaeon]|nr:hypothetical protein [Candidatus Nanoarchaeia archaeon]